MQEAKLLEKLSKQGTALSEKRKSASLEMGKGIESELNDLKMQSARFNVDFQTKPDLNGIPMQDGKRIAFDQNGFDRVEFLIAPNPGEGLKPLAKIASGGETARLMLALKGTLAHADATPTLIFDEIDQGIGGRVGAVVGQKLWMLTRANGAADAHAAEVAHQVLCITHLPQLAAYGDTHYTVNKQVAEHGGEERTTTVVRTLDSNERLAELTQMLGAPNAAGRLSVEEMLKEVAAVKGRLPERQATR